MQLEFNHYTAPNLMSDSACKIEGMLTQISSISSTAWSSVGI